MNKALLLAVTLIINDCALAAPRSDPVEALANKLNSEPMWPNGQAPVISLSSNATPREVVASAVKTWGFESGQIKAFEIVRVGKIRLDAMPECSAALIQSDLGRKILLFKYVRHGETGFWWTRFCDAPPEAEANSAANGVLPRFALYLVKAHHAEVAKTELENEPLLTEQDIVSYDWQTHTMTLTEAGEKKIPKTLGTGGKEFMIVADGRRCYRGAFWTSFSSISYPDPIIDVVQRGRTVRIQRAYPSERFTTGQDPRPDKRIRQVLEALGKIKNAEQDGPADGSQPIRPETSRTSSTAGSCR